MPCVSLQRKTSNFQENPSDLDAQLLELGFLCEKDDGAWQIAENYGFYAAHISRWVSTDPYHLLDIDDGDFVGYEISKGFVKVCHDDLETISNIPNLDEYFL